VIAKSAQRPGSKGGTQSATFQLMPANASDEPLQIVNLPDYCSFSLEWGPEQRKAGACRPIRARIFSPPILMSSFWRPGRKRNLDLIFPQKDGASKAEAKSNRSAPLNGPNNFALFIAHQTKRPIDSLLGSLIFRNRSGANFSFLL